MKLGRIAVIAACVIGAGSLPALGASTTVASSNLTPFRTCTLTAFQATTTAEYDAPVEQDFPTTNFAGLASLWVRSFITARNRRSYVRFDLTRCNPAIPSTATVATATLRLWTSNAPAACRTEDVFRVTSSWTEAGITWNNQPFGAALNNPASASRTASANLGPVGCQYAGTGQYVSWNVLADVQPFVAGTVTNNGWMIRDDVEDAALTQAATYEPRDASSVPHAPQLIVDYK